MFRKIATAIKLVRGSTRSLLNRLRGSRGQYGEDILVARALRRFGITRPYYLDIGANEPELLSNTYYFYARGARGVCVEANPVLCDAFRAARPRDVCVNVGVVPEASGPLPFYLIDPHQLSTFDKDHYQRTVAESLGSLVSVVEVPTLTLHELVERHCEQPPDFLSLDVEGSDYLILRSVDFGRFRPKVVCVETLCYSTDPAKIRRLTEIPELLARVGYRAVAETLANTVFVSEA